MTKPQVSKNAGRNAGLDVTGGHRGSKPRFTGNENINHLPLRRLNPVPRVKHGGPRGLNWLSVEV